MDPVSAGVYDSFRVIRNAIASSSSIASNLLLCDELLKARQMVSSIPLFLGLVFYSSSFFLFSPSTSTCLQGKELYTNHTLFRIRDQRVGQDQKVGMSSGNSISIDHLLEEWIKVCVDDYQEIWQGKGENCRQFVHLLFA